MFFYILVEFIERLTTKKTIYILALAYEFLPAASSKCNSKKFMVGYEMFGMPQRDVTAEQAVQKLKELV